MSWKTCIIIIIFLSLDSSLILAQGLKPRSATRADITPPELEGAKIVEKFDSQVPLDVEFRDEAGEPITFKSIFDDRRPVILTFYYSRCPMLCSLLLGDLVNVLNQSPWIVGDKFRIVSISMDHTETPEDAAATKQGYLDRYTPPEVDDASRFTVIQRSVDNGELVARWKDSENAKLETVAVDPRTAITEGWTFLTGSQASIRKVADAVGFQFNYIEKQKQFAHPTALIILSPSGKVVSYIHGLSYQSKDLTSRVLSAALSEPTESSPQFLYSCFHLTKPTGFALIASQALSWAAFLFLLLFIAVAVIFYRKRKRRGDPSEHLTRIDRRQKDRRQKDRPQKSRVRQPPAPRSDVL